MQKIIVVTTDGFSREDGNVYYAGYLLVSSDTLGFNEPVFGGRGDFYDDMSGLVEHLRGLGYHVDHPDCEIIAFSAKD